MRTTKIFESFAADFEQTYIDDDWSRLERYLTDDSSYINVGLQDEKTIGRDNILVYLKQDVEETDRKFGSRVLSALTEPEVHGDTLSRRWRTTYTLDGVPDLVVEGEARYVIKDDIIQEIEQELTPESVEVFTHWMRDYGDRLSS